MLTEKQKKERGWYYVGHDKFYWRNCDNCGLEYRGMGSNFCSRKCSANLRLLEEKDGSVSIELKKRSVGHNYGEKISAAKKGKPAHPNSISAMRKARLGVPLTEEHKRKCSIALSGSNHPNWKVDRTQLKTSEKKHLDSRYIEWMKAVKHRDMWKCRLACDECEGKMEAHHIYDWTNYPELRYQLKNGITLCHAHHPRGRANEAQLRSFLIELNGEIL